MLSSFRYIYFQCVSFCFYSIAENVSEVRACANLFPSQRTWLQARTLRVFRRCRPFTFSQEMHFLKRETNYLFFMDSEVKQKWMDERDEMAHCMSILPVHMLVLCWASTVLMGSCTTLLIYPVKYSETGGSNAWALPVKHENNKYKICRNWVKSLS